MWEDLLKNYNENDPMMEEKLQKVWEESIKSYEMTGDEKFLNESWQAMGDLEEVQYQDFSKEYTFKENN